MRRLHNMTQAYDWGSTSDIPRFLGRTASGEPVAELWAADRAGSGCAIPPPPWSVSDYLQGSGIAGDAMGLGAGMALGQTMAQAMQQGLQPPAAAAPPVPAAAPVVALQPDEIMATLEKLADLKAKGILTDEEFAAKKTELLKKLV